MQHRLFCRPQHQLVSYHNDFTVGWCGGLDWKERPQHRGCLRYERERNECRHDCTLDLRCEERFHRTSDSSPSSSSSAIKFSARMSVSSSASTRAHSALIASPTATGNPVSKS